MTEVNFQNNKIEKAKTVSPKMGGNPVCMATQANPIYNYNGYVPTYQQPYYTTNYGYQTPKVYSQYPIAQAITNPQAAKIPQTGQNVQTPQNSQVITNPQITQTPQITPGATIDAGGTKCEIPPGTNGLNIIINNPTVATPGSQPMINTNTNCINGNGSSNGGSQAPANAPAASTEKPKKKKNVVVLTDEYIKNLENYLRNPDKELKVFAMNEVSARFQEDERRKTNPSLNALLNLGLQAKEPNVRFIGLWLLKKGLASGNDVTIRILNNMQQSSVYKGMEASDAKKALLKMSETIAKVPDNSPEIAKTPKKEDKE